MATNHSGILRRIDSLGRFVLPRELRRTLQIETNDFLRISVEGKKIILEKQEDACAICGGEADLVSFNNKRLCKSCIQLIKDYL